ncbi:MAG: hypothetical protein H0T79_16520, partial [Deltaproteobacteria bacterium]|nr:hypothetical protein [Deltaproteobacteria bacterium]
MSRWFLMLCLTVATATGTAWAQPANTDRAESASQVAERRVSELAAKRQKLAARYEEELRAI